MTQLEMRVTAYAYVHAHGLMQAYGTLDALSEIGYRAAGEARWQGIAEYRVPEGPFPAVHTWPERIWAGAILSMQRSPERRRPATTAPNPPRIENPGMTGQQVLAEMTAAAQRYRALTDAAISNLGQLPPNSNPGIPDWWEPDPARYDMRPGSGYNPGPYDDEVEEWNPGWPPMSSEDMQ